MESLEHVAEERSHCKEVFKVTKRRFLVLLLFAFIGFITQVQYVCFSTVVRATEEKYDVNAFTVNLLSILIPVIYVLGVFPLFYLFNKIGLRYGIIGAAGLNTIATALKFISIWVPYIGLLIVAQIFVAACQLLTLGLGPLVASVWFPAPERAVATSVGTLFGFIGMAVGMFYGPYIVSLPNQMSNMHWGVFYGVQFGFILVVSALSFFLIPGKPKYRPASTSTHVMDVAVWPVLKTQLKSFNIMLLTISFGIITGLLTAVAAMLTQILEPFGISSDISGTLAFSGILGGSASCVVAGLLMDRYHCYRKLLLLLGFATLALLIPIAAVSKGAGSNMPVQIVAYIVIPLVECLVLPMVPVGLELIVELTFPAPEHIAATVLLASMCLWSVIGMLVFSCVVGDTPTKDLALLSCSS
ncbi:hypothetical protein STCU_00240 [Strigomonas culicis]|uniref:Major facilitator superfamily (MFS) profile domain-containing protein n=1 Tax=Strigomonas culicis TaxID=28005 RepID=S9V1W2_9TRYP|nr:hypothetical protein STCU_00240 [Strigomonas culicis]|eukprot:EPY37057.1 hypothetical protein STCU_00240 [Strigomonas culicis]